MQRYRASIASRGRNHTWVIEVQQRKWFTTHDFNRSFQGHSDAIVMCRLSVAYSCKFYVSFFAFGYAIPLSSVCVLYGMMLHRLRTRKAPSTSAAASATRSTATAARSRKSKRATGDGDPTSTSRRSSSKRRVTRLVIVVVVIFALSWLPAQVYNTHRLSYT